MNISTSQKNTQIHEVLWFLSTNKERERERKKKELIRDKVEIENFKMWVIKWESWNNNREDKNFCGGGGGEEYKHMIFATHTHTHIYIYQ